MCFGLMFINLISSNHQKVISQKDQLKGTGGQSTKVWRFVTWLIRYSLPQQELVNSLLFPHALYNQAVKVDKESAAKATGNPTNRQRQKPEWKSIQCWNTASAPLHVFWDSLTRSQTMRIHLFLSILVFWHQTNQHVISSNKNSPFRISTGIWMWRGVAEWELRSPD